uniref:Src homology 2 domain containing F n=1 Tax=Zonotrichia albicollis TaxID=44394 RepID=A0A8D2QII2_ZONAL
MARWLREHLGFRSARPAPPAPPKPDYRPDIVAAYRLQKERDFEDPYSGPPPAVAPDGPRYVSPKHRLIKVEAVEKVPASPSPPPPNDGYMEPYEAQKMMGLREAPARPLPLYDTPYEPVLDMDSDCSACPRPRESRLPEDDERPPEEYDQPWEWKKERISKAFAGDQPGAEPWLQTGASSVPLSCRGRLPVSGVRDEGRPGPALPPNPASLCPCRSSQGFMHMKLSRTQENKYVLGQHSPPFDSVPEIIHHYASRKLPIKGAEHMSLLYPVAIRTL